MTTKQPKQRMSTGKRGPQQRLSPEEDSQLLENLPEKTFRQIETEALQTGEPALLGLEALVEMIDECREAKAHLHGTPKDQAYYSNLYKTSNSLTGLARTMLEFHKYISEYDKLREHAKQEIFLEIQQAWVRDPELAEKVIEFMDGVLGD